MEKSARSILLIDDDEATNFLHQLIIKQAGMAAGLQIVTDGQQALDYLAKVQQDKQPAPDLIFLDINMPIMDGWEFLEHYHNLKFAGGVKPVVILLTTSINPEDAERAERCADIAAFKNKTLSIDVLHEIMNTYFPVTAS